MGRRVAKIWKQNPVKLHLNYTFKQFLNKQEHNIPILFSLQYTAACPS